MLKCRVCREWKPYHEFSTIHLTRSKYIYKGVWNGRYNLSWSGKRRCKFCTNKYKSIRYASNPKWKILKSLYSKKERRELRDGYIKHRLAIQLGISSTEIPSELVSLKRLQLKARRETNARRIKVPPNFRGRDRQVKTKSNDSGHGESYQWLYQYLSKNYQDGSGGS